MSDDTSTVTSIPTTFSDVSTAADTSAAKPSFNELVPTDYREKPWVQDFAKSEDPLGALFKSYENAQTLIRSKSGEVRIPGEGSTPDEIAAFNKALGVPESPDKYEFQMPDISKEPEEIQNIVKEAQKDSALMQTMAKVAHEAGIPQKAFAKLAEAFLGWDIEQLKAGQQEQAQAVAKRNEEQMQKFNGYYGDRAGKVQQVAKEVAQKVIPKEVADLGDPEIALHHAMLYIHENVFKNGSVITDATSGAPGLTETDVRKQLAELRATPAFQNEIDRGHEAAMQKYSELAAQLVEIRKRS